MRIGTEWKVVATATLGLALGPGAILVYGAGVFFVPLERAFGWSRAEVSAGASIVHFAILLVLPVQGFLLDRWGTRKVALPSIPLFAAGLAAFYFLPASLSAYYALCGLVTLLGLGLFPASYLRAVGTWFDRRLGLAIGIANAGVGLGGAIVPVICAALIAHAGWRAAYLALAAAVLVVTLPPALLFLRDAPDANDGPRPDGAGSGFAALLAGRSFWLLAVAFLLFGGFNGAIIAHQVPMLIDAGWTPGRAALVQGLFGAAHISGRVLAGWLLDRIAPSRIMIAFLALAMIGCGIDALGPGGDLAYLAAIGFGLLVGAELDVLAFLARRNFGLAAFGRIYGTVFAIFQLGAIVSVSLFGAVRQEYGSYAAGLWTLAAICAVLIAIFARLGRATA